MTTTNQVANVVLVCNLRIQKNQKSTPVQLEEVQNLSRHNQRRHFKTDPFYSECGICQRNILDLFIFAAE